MKHKAKWVKILAICLVFGILGVSCTPQNMEGPQAKIVKAESQTQESRPEPTSTQEPSGGSTYSQSIVNQLGGLIQKLTINQVIVRVSKVVRAGSRAFVNLCMDQAEKSDPLDFGSLRISYPGGKSENFYVHELPQSEMGRCLVLEFKSIPPETASKGWKLNMDWVGFAQPQEGSECDAYQRRAQASGILKSKGIQFSCNEEAGNTSFEISQKPDTMTEQDAKDLVNQVVSGIIKGPWVFDLTVK